MEADWTSKPESFRRANSRAREKHLESLTLEQAAAELEALLELQTEFPVRGEVHPLPPQSIAILLTGAPHEDDEPPSRS